MRRGDVARGRGARAITVVAMVLLAACGYRPVHEASPSGGLHVALASSSVADAIASDEVLAGAREELARHGALAAGEGWPRVEIEVLRADEASEAITAAPNAEGRLVPTSQATRVGILVRAWVLDSRDGERRRDTGDVRAMEVVAVPGDARTAAFRHADALRAASRRAGKKLADRVLGLPSASED